MEWQPSDEDRSHRQENCRKDQLELAPNIAVEIACDEGTNVEAGTAMAVVGGSTLCILTGEQTALNIITPLSGIATATRGAVEAIRDYAPADKHMVSPGWLTHSVTGLDFGLDF